MNKNVFAFSECMKTLLVAEVKSFKRIGKFLLGNENQEQWIFVGCV